MTQELTPEALKIIERVHKLLALADKNPNAAEAAAAANKAQEMLEAYNLDSATIERASGKTGAREEKMVAGGMYRFQRELWADIAALNFCVYFTRRKRSEEQVRTRHGGRKFIWRFHHHLVGRTVNVRAAQHMGAYLETAIERLLTERLNERSSEANSQRFSNWANSFRQGAAADICDRLRKRRRIRLSEEAAREREAMERAAAGASTATALTLASLVKRERDANMDFIHGEGWSAEQAARRAEWAREAAEEEAAAARWAAEHPEEARAQAEAERKRQERLQKAEDRRRAAGIGPRGGGGGARDNTDYGAWSAGKTAARNISLDEQAGERKVAGRLGHG